MKIKEIIKHIDEWAPPGAAWSKDNVGVQVGSSEENITNILLCLDITTDVVMEATSKNCNLIISHHPFIFHPIKKLDITKDKKAALIALLLKNNITVFSAHTNLDFTKNGVSYQLAKRLGLNNIQFLSNLSQNQYKLTVFIPETHLAQVSDAIFSSGGGVIGDYTHCGFRTAGIGSFKGNQDSNPTIGEPGKFETVQEIKLETLVYSWKVNDVMKAVKAAHPYEEVAFDLYKVDNLNVNFGAGAIGELESEMSESDFLSFVSDKLKISSFRYTPGNKTKIKKVAVCGGSGINYLTDALGKADAYITGDIKYHDFFDAKNEILLIDAGHFETEIGVLTELKNYLEKYLSAENRVYEFSGSTNPIVFFNN
jgi:dinuclear metal center YbgI/SA1388 family protein